MFTRIQEHNKLHCVLSPRIHVLQVVRDSLLELFHVFNQIVGSFVLFISKHKVSEDDTLGLENVFFT
jgi:hypothetical protein